MEYRPSKTFVLCMTPLLLTGVAATWAWNKANGASLQERAQESFFKLAIREPSKPQLDIEDAVAWASKSGERRTKCRETVERLAAEFPGLRIEPKPVPDEENAFLLLHKISGFPHSQGPSASKELSNLISGRTPWDSTLAKAALDADSDIVAHAERVAAMTGRSSSNMPDNYHGFVVARTGKLFADVLMIKARIAAEAKDEEEALRLVSASRNLARHYLDIDKPILLSATVSILIDIAVTNAAFEHLLPSLGREADLERWKDALRMEPYSPARFADLMRGEWSATVEFYLMPVVMRQAPPDGEELVRIYTSNYEAFVLASSERTLIDTLDGGCEALSEGFSHLSPKSQEIAEAFFIGSKAWAKGYIRAERIRALQDAALELLTLEWEGEALTVDTAAEVTLDPLSGQPFVFDIPARTLLLPAASGNHQTASLKLP